MRFVVAASIASLPLVGGCSSAPQAAADCHPTFGDNCDCEPKCMTDAEEAALGDFCDVSCVAESGGYDPDWTCTIEDAACAVVP